MRSVPEDDRIGQILRGRSGERQRIGIRIRRVDWDRGAVFVCCDEVGEGERDGVPTCHVLVLRPPSL